MNDAKQHCCLRLCRVPSVAEVVQARSPRGRPGTCQHQSQVGVNRHGASRNSDHSDVVTPGENGALSVLTVKA